jgi:hypothetical protein
MPLSYFNEQSKEANKLKLFVSKQVSYIDKKNFHEIKQSYLLTCCERVIKFSSVLALKKKTCKTESKTSTYPKERRK